MLHRLIRESAIYGGSDALVRIVAFVTFPIIAAELSSEGFGVLELAMTIVMLGSLFARCGMNNAVQRFYWDAETNEAERPTLVTAGLLITLVSGLAIAVVVYLVHPIIFRTAGVDTLVLGSVGALGLTLLLPLTQWAQYVQDVLRLHFAPWKFMGFSFVTRALAAILSVLALIWLNAGVGGVLIAQAMVLLVALPMGLWFIRRDLVASVDPRWARRLVHFGAPFILTEMAIWLFSSIDRWMLAAMVGSQEVGVYSAAFRISVLASFVAMAFGMAWSPYAVKLQSDYPTRFKTMYAEVLVLLLVAMLAIGGFIALFSAEIVRLLLPNEYAGAATALSILSLCVVAQASQQVTAVGISMSRKTHLFAYLVWTTAGINALINLALIPYLGAAGAAWATLMSHVLLTIGYLVCSNLVYPIPFPTGRLLLLAAIGAVLLVSALSLQSTSPTIGQSASKLAILVACLLLAGTTVRWRDLLHPADNPNKK